MEVSNKKASDYSQLDDYEIEEMLHKALFEVTELSKERNRRIQNAVSDMSKKTVDMFSEYQKSLQLIDPAKLFFGGKL